MAVAIASRRLNGERLTETLALGSRREISDAGHLVNQDGLRAFKAVCAEFFASLDPIGGQPAFA